MIRCPYCESPESMVVETRHHPDGLYRRRQCGYCLERYSTIEAAQALQLGRPKGGGGTTLPTPPPKPRSGPLRRK